MATKAAKQDTTLPGMEDVDDDPNVTPAVTRKANKFKKISIEKSNIGDRYKTDKQALIDQMKEDGCTRVKVVIDGNAKWLVLREKDELKEVGADKLADLDD